MTKLTTLLKYIFLSFISFLSIFPFFWMIIGATNTSTDIAKGKTTIGSNLSINIQNIFQNTNISAALVNSIIISVISTILALLISSMAGYGFEIYKSKFRNNVMSFLLLSMMIPFSALMIPLYSMFGKMGLLNSLIAVIIPSVATAFLIFFFRQNTISFPRETIEAARVDGLSELNIFFRIYFPMMKSTYAAAAIITFMASWNNYMWPLIALQSQDKQTLPLVISALGSAYSPDYGMTMVGIVIATLPTALIFFLMQKHFVQGMVGSVK